MYCKIFGDLPSTIIDIFKQDLQRGSVEKFREILCEEWFFLFDLVFRYVGQTSLTAHNIDSVLL
jgi:hypothetical protein